MILKAKDLRDKTVEELNEELETLRKDLFQAKMDFHARRLENSSSMREMRKSIARIETILREKELEEGLKELVAELTMKEEANA